ncbi:MAG TPA: chemotaxis protein CheD [Pseudomonas sp.]|nr:chemotaxis protein CheD [Pseudomonas sp.]
MSTKRFLNPGGLYFGSGDLWVETLLGPCVAITLWFPEARKGGICHFQLPGRRRVAEHARELDGRYGSEAWTWLKQQVRAHALVLAEAQVKLFGGARSLTNPTRLPHSEIGGQNIDWVEQEMSRAGMQVISRDLGGEGCRFLRFDLATGEVWVRRGAALSINRCEVQSL